MRQVGGLNCRRLALTNAGRACPSIAPITWATPIYHPPLSQRSENVADDPFLPDRLRVRLDRDICQRVPGDGFELERELGGSVRHQKMLGARYFRLVVFSTSDLHFNSIKSERATRKAKRIAHLITNVDCLMAVKSPGPNYERDSKLTLRHNHILPPH
jgi:hypothetical protein